MNKRVLLLSGLILVVLMVSAACTIFTLPVAVSTTAAPAQDVSLEEPVQPATAEVKNAALEESKPLLQLDDTGLQSALIEVYQKANPSVVYILTQTGSGSGFVYDDQGHIVTNNHVVERGGRYEVAFPNGEQRWAELVGADPDSDLAVLKVADLPDGIEPLPMADPDTLMVGQIVIAIGSPFGEQGSMSMGIISGLGRSLSSQRVLESGGSYSLPEVIQTDAPINPGNSGGPLLNLQGEVVGVNSVIATATGTNSGVGFAIPGKAVTRIVPALIEDGEVEYPYMGLSFDNEITLAEKDIYGVPQTRGAYEIDVSPGGPADRAGIRGANLNTGRGGDLVIAVDGRPVNTFTELNSYLIFEAEVGQTIELTVLRDGEELTIPLTLGRRP